MSIRRRLRSGSDNPTEVIVGAGADRDPADVVHDRVSLRPTGGDGDAAINAAFEVSLEDPQTGEARELGTDIRDELIALEHAASYVV